MGMTDGRLLPARSPPLPAAGAWPKERGPGFRRAGPFCGTLVTLPGGTSGLRGDNSKGAAGDGAGSARTFPLLGRAPGPGAICGSGGGGGGRGGRGAQARGHPGGGGAHMKRSVDTETRLPARASSYAVFARCTVSTRVPYWACGSKRWTWSDGDFQPEPRPGAAPRPGSLESPAAGRRQPGGADG